MVDINNQNTWVIYKHTSPSGKVYIGITHYENPQKRWGKNGRYYSKRTVFYKAIQKYGWDNIIHEILFRRCSEELAKILEKAYIKYFQDLNMSYNMTIGGDGHNFGKNCGTTEYNTKRSKLYRQKHPEFDKEQYQKHKVARKKNARKWYWKNREKVLENKKNNLDSKEKARIRAALWRVKHPNYMKEYMKKYNNKNKKNKNE